MKEITSSSLACKRSKVVVRLNLGICLLMATISAVLPISICMFIAHHKAQGFTLWKMLSVSECDGL
jgi:hypothetical protein